MTDADLKDLKDKYDINQDGNVTDEEINTVHKMDTFQNENEKSDAQKRMAWFALGGMLLYPLCVIVTVIFGWVSAATILGSMASTYFGSVAVIVSAFFGSQAYSKKKM